VTWRCRPSAALLLIASAGVSALCAKDQGPLSLGVTGSSPAEPTRNATAILPATTFAEMEGTFINHEGRVQRFHQALVPPGVARPTWMILRRLLGLEVGEGGTLEARDAFAVAARESGELAGLNWDEVGLKGVNPGGSTAPAAKQG